MNQSTDETPFKRNYNPLPLIPEFEGMVEEISYTKPVGDPNLPDKYYISKYIMVKPDDPSIKNSIIFVYRDEPGDNSPIFTLKIINYVSRPIIDGKEYKPDFTVQSDYEKYHPYFEFTYEEGLEGDKDNTTRLFPYYTGEPSYYCLFSDGRFLVSYPGELWHPTNYIMFYKNKPIYKAESLLKDEFEAIDKTRNYIFTIED